MNKDEIIKALAAMDPTTDNDFGDVYCFFCGELLGYSAFDGNTTEHLPNCIWLAAETITETGNDSTNTE